MATIVLFSHDCLIYVVHLPPPLKSLNNLSHPPSFVQRHNGPDCIMTKLNSYRDVLHDIIQGASRFKQTLGPGPTMSSESEQKLYPRHLLTIPLPRPITSLFIARGFDSSTAEKLNQVYLDKASSLKQAYEHKHREVLHQCLDNGVFRVHDMDQFVMATHTAYIALYDQSLRDWQLKVDEMSREHASSHTDDKSAHYISERRSTFKIETVPTLERAFTANAYPSRLDKQGLAKETGMEYKQIDIWFQNRRARSKKEGMPLQRIATFAAQLHPPKPSTASPSSELRLRDVIEDQRPVASAEEPCSEVQLDFFAATRPVHAFPTPYPPLYDEDPFPVRRGAESFQHFWLRTVAAEPIQRPAVDMEQVTIQMSRLSLSSDVDFSSRSPLPSFALIIPRAPLPALIRTATASSYARPVATHVSVVGSSLGSRSGEVRQLYRALPIRLSVERQSCSQASAATGTRPIPISSSGASATLRSRRSETRSPSPRHSSRSSSISSLTSSHSGSSSWSAASSNGPLTPTTSPRIEALVFAKDALLLPPLPSSNTVDSGDIFSPLQ